MADLSALQAVVEGWGGKLLLCSKLPDHSGTPSDLSFSAAPFAWLSLGVSYKEKIIYAAPGFNAGSLIHEAGHVFATLKEPLWSNEVEFLGWEFVLARKVDLLEEWLDSMRDYSISSREFGYMPLDKQSDILEMYVEHARRTGLVVDDEPISLRG